MPSTKTKSKFAASMGKEGAQAVAKHRGDATNYGNVDLPAGIEGGVAQLIDCRLSQIKPGKKNAGMWFFIAAGSVISPEQYNGIPTKGLRTQIMEVIGNTPTRSRKTVDEHIEWVLNEVRKFGVDTKKITINELETVLAALKKKKPKFRFRTWKGQKQTEGPYAGMEPMTQHSWNGLYTGETEAPAPPVQDDSGPEEPEEPDVEDVEEEEGEEVNFLELGEQADAGDEDALTALVDAAKEAGIDPEDDEYDTWMKLAEALDGAEGEEEEGEEEEEEEEEEFEPPQKEEVFLYKPPRKKKAIEVEVLAVNSKKKTVTVKNSETGKKLKGVIPWDKLQEITVDDDE